MADRPSRRSSRRHKYQPLPQDFYRVLELQPGSDDDPLVGVLAQIKLPVSESKNESSTGPSYEAVSYAWDRPEGRVSRPKLYMKDGNYLRLSPGLYQILLKLRLADRV